MLTPVAIGNQVIPGERRFRRSCARYKRVVDNAAGDAVTAADVDDDVTVAKVTTMLVTSSLTTTTTTTTIRRLLMLSPVTMVTR